LKEAAKGGRVEEVLSLLRDNPGLNVNWADSDQGTALHWASWNGQVEVVKVLLAHPTHQRQLQELWWTNSLFRRLLGWPCVCSVCVLLKDPRVNVTMADNNGCTPKDIIKLLSGSLQAAEILETSQTQKDTEEPLPLKKQESRDRVKFCHCLNDSWPTHPKPGNI